MYKNFGTPFSGKYVKTLIVEQKSLHIITTNESHVIALSFTAQRKRLSIILLHLHNES